MASEKESATAADSSQSQQTNQANNKDGIVATSVQNEIGKEKKKSIRRAFSMPRNPFRLSRRVKITNTANNNEQNAETTAAALIGADAGNQSMNGNSMPEQQQQLHEQDNKHRIFRRSAWKKFLSRIAQQMTSSSIGVSTVHSMLLCSIHWPYANVAHLNDSNSIFIHHRIRVWGPSMCVCLLFSDDFWIALNAERAYTFCVGIPFSAYEMPIGPQKYVYFGDE